MSNRPNFYRLLRLDPSEETWSVIEKRIDELAKEFNRVRTDSTKSQQRDAEAFQIYLGSKDAQRPDTIYTVMSDPATRRKEAANRKEEMLREGPILKSMLQFLQLRGAYNSKDIAEISRQLPGLDEGMLRQRLKELGIVEEGVKKAPASKPVSKPMLSDAEALSIEADLRGLQLSSLYEFLGSGLDRKSSLLALAAAYQQQEEMIAKLVKGTAEHKVRSALLSHVKAQLLAQDCREKYDNYLDGRGLRQIDSYIRLAGGETKLITGETLDTIIKFANVPGITATRVREYVEEWVGRTKGWTLAVGSTVSAEKLQSCGYCGKLALDFSQQKCQSCGKPLNLRCPNPRCTQLVATEHACCSKCGYSTGDARLVERLLDDANSFLKSMKFTNAQSCIETVLRIWPDYQEALDIRANVRIGLEKQARRCEVFEDLVRLRKFTEAQQLAAELEQHGHNVNPMTRKRFEDAIARGQSACAEASRLAVAGNTEKALEKYVEALTHCADLPEANAAINKHPPTAPHQLDVQVCQSLARLKWKCDNERKGTTFVVRRKKGGLPSCVTDGEELCRINHKYFDDTTLEDGLVYYYAVYSVWGETPSREAASSVGILFPLPVKDLSATSFDGRVKLTWKKLLTCRMVEVSRSPGDMRRQIQVDEFSEEGLKLGSRFTFDVVALYSDPNSLNQFVRSTPASIVVDITPRPQPVMDLSFVIVQNRASLKWTRPRVGRVEIRQTFQKPDDAVLGALMDVSKARSFGDEVTTSGLESADAPLPSSGQIFLVPLTVSGSTAVVGKWVHVANLPEVKNLQCRPMVEGRAKLTWDWPPGINVVRIQIYAIPGDTAAPPVLELTEEVARASYERNGSIWTVQCTRALPYRITVASKALHGEFYSKGISQLELFGRETRINYQVCSGRKLWVKVGAPWIELRVDTPSFSELRGIIIVGLPDRLPMRIDDGEILKEVKIVGFREGRAEIPLQAAGLLTPLYVKLFLSQPDLYPGLRLMPASKEKLLLQP